MSRRRLLDGLAPVAALVVAAGVLGAVRGGFTDLDVYRYGGRALLAGRSAYEARDPLTGLRFTYPPFATLPFVPVAMLPARLAAGVWTAASVAALAAVVALVRRVPLRSTAGRPAPGWLVALVVAAAVGMEPVWQDLRFGQVNLLLMLLVLADLLLPQQRWSGVLVGIAAGVKLTPLVFVVLLVLVGRRAAAGRALATFVGTVAVGFLVMPAGSASYWGPGVVAARRVGPPQLAHNQSVYGALTRLLDGPPSTVVWLAVAAPLAAGLLLVGARTWRRGDPVLGACLAALAMLVASPIAWSHHWVWAVPVGLVLWERSRPVAVAWVAVFVARPFVWLPWGGGREYGWNPAEHVVGNAYLLAALALGVWAALSVLPDGRDVPPVAAAEDPADDRQDRTRHLVLHRRPFLR